MADSRHRKKWQNFWARVLRNLLVNPNGCPQTIGAQEQVCQMVYFQTKKNNWVNFGGPWNGKVWYILWPFGIYTFCGHLMIWLDIFSHFGIICIKKNLATLLKKAKERRIHM
jgi:hypothetical protein